MNFPSLPAPTREDAARALENARLKAAINLEVLLDALTLRGLDPASNFKALLDSFEASYKVSGLAAKQAAAVASPVSVRINLNTPRGGVTIEASAQPAADALDTLGDPPDFPVLVSNLDELRCDVDE